MLTTINKRELTIAIIAVLITAVGLFFYFNQLSNQKAAELAKQEATYVAYINNHSEDVRKVIIKISEGLKEYAEGEIDWKLKVVDECENLSSVVIKIDDVIPPEKYISANTKYFEAMVFFDEFSYLLKEGVIKTDASKMKEASDKLTNGRELIIEALKILGIENMWTTQDMDYSNNTTKSESDEVFKQAYPGCFINLKEEVVFGNKYFYVLGLSKKENNESLSSKVVVCKYNSELNKIETIWAAPTVFEITGMDMNSIKDYGGGPIESLNILKPEDSQVALVVAQIYIGGAHGSSNIIVFTLDEKGTCVLRESESSGIMNTKKQNNKIVVEGEGDYGVHEFYISNNTFVDKIIPASEMAPENSIKLSFILGFTGPDEKVLPASDRTINATIGSTIALIPSNEKTKNLFDQGKISIFIQDPSVNSFAKCEATRLKTGNSFVVDKKGTYNIYMDYSSNFLMKEDNESTFSVISK